MAKRKKYSPAKVRKVVQAACGIYKQKPGEKSMVQELMEERRAAKEKEDRELEEARFERMKFMRIP